MGLPRFLRRFDGWRVGALAVVAASACGDDGETSSGRDAGSEGVDRDGSSRGGAAGRGGSTGGGVSTEGGVSTGSGGQVAVDGAVGAGGDARDGGVAGMDDGSPADGGEEGAGGVSDGGPGGAGAGGRPVDPGQPAVSGTRLKALRIVGADGSRVYRRSVLYDSKLEVECRYVIAADGALRCLPVVDPSGVQASLHYRDSDCTERYALIPAPPLGCSTTAQYAVNTTVTDGVCVTSIETHIYRLTDTLYSNPSSYRRVGTECERVSISLENRVAVAIGDEMDPEEFVEGTLETQP